MTTPKEQADEHLRKLTQHNKVCDFAMHILGIEDRYADMFAKSQDDRFNWTGVVLEFKGPNGNTVAINDPNCKGFFEREFPRLMPSQEAAAEKFGAADPALVASAKTGNLTAKMQLFRSLHGDRPSTTAENAATMVEVERILKTAVGHGGQDDGERQRDAEGKFLPEKKTGRDNPWSSDGWSLTRQMQIYKSDPALAGRLAKAAGSAIGATPKQRTA